MPGHTSAIAYYLERFRLGQQDAAFFGLRELPDAVLPELAQAFRESTDTSLRIFLLRVIWERRRPGAIPLLAEALFDSEPDIWPEAMDGLVVLAGPEALQALRRARSRHFTTNLEQQDFNEWLEEAIDLAESRLTT